jgi:hypothetical protein
VNNDLLLFVFVVKAFLSQRECSHACNLETSARPFFVRQSPHNITANYIHETSHHKKTRPTLLTADTTKYSTRSTSPQQKRLCPKYLKPSLDTVAYPGVSNHSNGANSNYASADYIASVTHNTSTPVTTSVTTSFHTTQMHKLWHCQATAVAREQLCGHNCFPGNERTRSNGRGVFCAVRSGAM